MCAPHASSSIRGERGKVKLCRQQETLSLVKDTLSMERKYIERNVELIV